MRVLGLDLSTKSGYAVIEDGQLIGDQFGVIRIPAVTTHRLEDMNLLLRSRQMATELDKLILKYRPDFIYVEQTNRGRARGTQKQLEFIHYAFLYECAENLGVADTVRYIDTSRWRSELKIWLSGDQRKHNKLVKNKLARGKITAKHLAVAWTNQTYGLALKLKDNDIADAICIAHCGYAIAIKRGSIESLDSALFPK